MVRPGIRRMRVLDAIYEAVGNVVIDAVHTQELPGSVTLSIDITPEQFAGVVIRDDGIGISARND